MHIIVKVVEVLWVAVAVAVLYVWGMKKSVNQSQDTMMQLTNKCVGIVRKQLKKQGHMTRKEIEAAISNVKAGPSWSQRKAIVQDPAAFGKQLTTYMIDNGWIARRGSRFVLTEAEQTEKNSE